MEPTHRSKVFDLAHSIPQSQDTGIRQFVDAPMKRKHKKPKQQQIATINEATDATESANEEMATEDS